MLERIKTILLVSVITLLVWVFAESESLQRRDLRIELQFVSDVPTERFIEVADEGFGGVVTVSLSGGATAISSVEDFARGGGLRLSIGNPAFLATPGEHTVPLREALRALPQFRASGLTIERVEPAAVRVRIVALETRDARVRVDVGEADLDGVPEVRPVTPKVYVPVNSVPPGPIEVVAPIRPDDIARLVSGRRESLSQVKLELPPNLRSVHGARIEPATASVTLAVKVRQASTELSGVPVQVRLAAGELSRWEISIPEQDRFIPKVRVSGPADQVEQVKRGEIKVVASVSLSFEELERGITQKEINFGDLPSQLRFEYDTRLVRVSIKKREPRNP
ncbi:MAG: hypothetical protein K2Y21_06360 [Phycisphaerales bacterium]|nr:hypothetical protein [Phycisphaerales bacterium]